MGQHRPRIPARRRLSSCWRAWLCRGLARLRRRGPGFWPARPRLGCRGLARLRLRLAIRQLLLHGGRAQAAEHRGLGDPQPAGDLAVGSAPGPPPGRVLPGAAGQLAGPSRSPHQPGGPLPQRPVMQRGHVVLGQPRHRGHRPAAEAELPAHRHRDVAQSGVGGGVAGQHHRSGQDPGGAVAVRAMQQAGVGHALQDGRGGWGHASILPHI